MEDKRIGLSEIVHGLATVRRNEAMKTSDQLTLGELKLLLEAIHDESKPVVFDFALDVYPQKFASWRGAYEEIAIGYGPTPTTVGLLLNNLTIIYGEELTGWKGGEFLMGKTTPVWVANSGDSSVEKSVYGEWKHVAVVGVDERKEKVFIETKEMEY